MGKYHINLKGEVAICRAMLHCSLGGAHFDHQTEAIEYADRMNEAVINSKLPEDLDKIEIFKPIESKEVIEDSISFDGSGNSFLEVEELVFKDDSQNYHEFVKLVKKLK